MFDEDSYILFELSIILVTSFRDFEQKEQISVTSDITQTAEVF